MQSTNPEITTTTHEPSAPAGPWFAPLLTEKEVARRLALSVRTLQDWRFRGGGPKFLKCGSAIRYKWSDVEEWMLQQARESTADSGPEAAA
jgi:predicted DNA-binding transcriptional regulator AlpA